MADLACAFALPQVRAHADCALDSWSLQTEDCLLLDLYIPLTDAPPKGDLPVIVWLHGGAYVLGSKQSYDSSKVPFYVGDGLIDTARQKANRSLVFVTGNYRLGAFGWLAGTHIEQHAQTNVGLLDQRAILQFVHDHIQHDPKEVSLWGESAGAGSIFHHLAMTQSKNHNFTQKLFSKAILQSPAFQWLWDRSGTLNDTYSDFSQNAGCPSGDIECLRDASVDALIAANKLLFDEALVSGIIPVGPSVDGDLIPALAPHILAQDDGKYITCSCRLRTNVATVLDLDAIAVSHVDIEVPYSAALDNSSFLPLMVRKENSEKSFQDFLALTFPGPELRTIRGRISEAYPSSKYSDQIARVADIIRDSGFTCNTRHLANRYLSSNTTVHAMNYAVFSQYGTLKLNASVHGSDLLPEFANAATNYQPFMRCIANLSSWGAWGADYVIRSMVAPNMQEMFTKHALFGNPNHSCDATNCTYVWNTTQVQNCPDHKDGTCLNNVLTPMTDSIWPTTSWVWRNHTAADLQTNSRVCDFWIEVATNITTLLRQQHRVIHSTEQQTILAD